MRQARLPLIFCILATLAVVAVLFVFLRTIPEKTGDALVTPLPIATIAPSPDAKPTMSAVSTENPTAAATKLATPSPEPTPTALSPYELNSTPYAGSALTIADAYRAATIDAMLAESSETHALVDLIPGNVNATLDESGRALLITYIAISGATTDANEPLPAFSEKELAARCKDEGLSGSESRDIALRLRELMGLEYSADELVMTVFVVNVDDVFRPAYDADPRAHSDATDLPSDAPDNYVEWFNARIIASYYPLSCPWTRLGYSYDWNPTTPEYGLSEFMVKPDSQIEVKYSLSADEFVLQNS